MSEAKPKRKFWQFHLGTAGALMLVAPIELRSIKVTAITLHACTNYLALPKLLRQPRKLTSQRTVENVQRMVSPSEE
jgi:hypothetical protein